MSQDQDNQGPPEIGIINGHGYIDIWDRWGNLTTIYTCPSEIREIPTTDQELFDQAYYEALAENEAKSAK